MHLQAGMRSRSAEGRPGAVQARDPQTPASVGEATALHLGSPVQRVKRAAILTAAPVPAEQLIGIVTAVVGAPVFLGILRRRSGLVDPRCCTRVISMSGSAARSSSRLAFPFTVEEVLRMGRLAGRFGDKPEIVPCALDRVGLRRVAARIHPDLSGGEQQRAQLAGLLAQVWEPSGPDGPNWPFLDEPVTGLDIVQQLAVMRIALDFAGQGGCVVAVMHDLNLTAMFAGAVCVLHAGRIAATRPPARVMTSDFLSRVHDCDLRVCTPPPDTVPYVLPQASVAAMGGGGRQTP